MPRATRESLSRRRRKRKEQPCPMCHQKVDFLWTCPCGFSICAECLQKDLWGFTCNSMTWVCPDCGEIRSF